MVLPASGRFPASWSLHGALVLLGVTVAVLGGVEIVLLAASPAGPLWLLAGLPVTGEIYAAAGLMAWWRRPSNRIGALLVAGALSWLIAGLANADAPVLSVPGVILSVVPAAVVIHLLLAFPSGRLRTRAAQVTAFAAYVCALLDAVPQYVFAAATGPDSVLAITDRPDLAALGRDVNNGAGSLVLVATAVILAGRLRRAEPARRRVLLPLFGYGVLAVLLVSVSAWLEPLLGVPARFTVQLAVLAGVPVAFALVLLHGGFARTGEIAELGAWLSTAAAGRAGMADALARTLGDPSLQVLFWLPGQHAYVDAAVTPVARPAAGTGGAAAEITSAGHRVGAIVYDATLIDDVAPVRAAGQVLALAVEAERLTAQLRAREAELRRSRARIVQASDQERRRVARNLHDGLQVRLVLLALDAQQLAKDPDATAGMRKAAAALRGGIDAAAAELRSFVHAMMPAGLIERGLAAAVEDLVDRAPIRTRLNTYGPCGTQSRPPAAVESTAYFVVAEGLANALKHARARELTVRLAHTSGHLVVEVDDDGIGGADLDGGGAEGSGLRGLADRVEALGGRLLCDSPPGAGTKLAVELPCGS
jgi:signal transduction histidine kinase